MNLCIQRLIQLKETGERIIQKDKGSTLLSRWNKALGLYEKRHTNKWTKQEREPSTEKRVYTVCSVQMRAMTITQELAPNPYGLLDSLRIQIYDGTETMRRTALTKTLVNKLQLFLRGLNES